MRGSPLLNALLVLLAIVACGSGLHTLTGRSAPAPQPAVPPPPAAATGHENTPFDLLLSHPARSVRLEPGSEGKAIDLPAGAGPHRGRLALDPAHPVVFIDIEWEDPSTDSHHFAKLTLEPPNQPTLSHTFDSAGPLSDAWEIRSSVTSH